MTIQDEDVINGLNEVFEIAHNAGGWWACIAAAIWIGACLSAPRSTSLPLTRIFMALEWRSILTKFRPFWNAAGFWLPPGVDR